MKKVQLLSSGLAVLCLAALVAQPVLGSWAALSDAELLIHSDLVVWGELSDRKDAGEFSTATLTIKTLIKGSVKGKSVTLRFPGPRPRRRVWKSTDISFRGDEKAIWHLKKNTDGTYSAFYPMQFRTENKTAKQVKAKVAALTALVKQTAPREMDLADAITETAKNQGTSLVFRLQAAFHKETKTHTYRDRRTGKQRTYRSVSWFLADGDDIKVRVAPGRLMKLAEKSTATGEKVGLEVLSRTYGRGKGLQVQMQVLREVKKLAPKPKPATRSEAEPVEKKPGGDVDVAGGPKPSADAIKNGLSVMRIRRKVSVPVKLSRDKLVELARKIGAKRWLEYQHKIGRREDFFRQRGWTDEQIRKVFESAALKREPQVSRAGGNWRIVFENVHAGGGQRITMTLDPACKEVGQTRCEWFD